MSFEVATDGVVGARLAGDQPGRNHVSSMKQEIAFCRRFDTLEVVLATEEQRPLLTSILGSHRFVLPHSRRLGVLHIGSPAAAACGFSVALLSLNQTQNSN